MTVRGVAVDEATSQDLRHDNYLDARPSDPHHDCHLATVPSSLHRLAFQPSEAFRHAALGQQLGMSHVPVDTAYNSSMLRDIGFQKIAEGVHFLEKALFERSAEAQTALEGAKRELGEAQQEIASLKVVLNDQASSQRAQDDSMNKLREDVRLKDKLLARKGAELTCLRNSADARKAEVKLVQEKKLMYKWLSIINAPSGFDTFREVARKAYPDLH